MTKLEQDIETKRAELIKLENQLVMERFRQNAKKTTGMNIDVTTEKQLYSISIEEHNFGQILEIIMQQDKI